MKGLWGGDRKLGKTASLPELHKSMPPMEIAPKPSLQVPGRGGRKPKPRRVAFHVDVPSTPRGPVTPKKNMKRIEHLCLVMQKLEPSQGQSCLGVIDDKYLVWPLTSSSPESAELVSLGSLLIQDKVPQLADRLVLGVQLASTVLQLHKTGWLSENWGNEDIFFNQMVTKEQTPDFKRPLLRQAPEPSVAQAETMHEVTKSALIPHDQSLFCLGVVLMELWYGCPLESLWVPGDEIGSRFNTNCLAAMRLASEISSVAGVKYGDSVRRCIRGLDHRSESLEIDDFKNEVHMKVVIPLVENLETWCGKTLGEIFPERRKMPASM